MFGEDRRRLQSGVCSQGGGGKARFNVATPTNATVTCNSIRITV